MIKIYYACISEELHPQLMQKYGGCFSKDFSERLLRFRHWQDAQLSLLGRLLIKYGFEKNRKNYVDRDLVYSEFKKPFHKSDLLQFNISHSGKIAICALSNQFEVGIDIEEMQKVDIADYKFQMTMGEWEKVNKAYETIPAFYDYWTQKEAVVKAIGHGLSIPLNSFEVINGYSRIGGDDFFVQAVPINKHYRCHIAFKGDKGACLTPERIYFK